MIRSAKIKRRKRLLVVFAAVFFVIFAVVRYYTKTVRPILVMLSEEKMRAVSIEAINDAVGDTLLTYPNYTDMLVLSYDKNNNISHIGIKSVMINAIAEECTTRAQERISAIGMQGISVPYGSLSGITFLSGKGPSAKIQVMPVGSVRFDLKSEFNEVGINQTNHRIYLDLETRISIILPGANNTITVNVNVLILENIIAGKVPDTYLNSNSMQDMLDLVP